jgi:hypothetical protein
LAFVVNKREAFELPLSEVASSSVGGKTDVNLVFQPTDAKRDDEMLVRRLV